ncbi:MAG: hydroxylamine oxidation protein HaoB [Hyphomicrobiales bacterium]|nr:hydroxylamine oxidation protein HaoB [Hyphomicrobiales bacterium]
MHRALQLIGILMILGGLVIFGALWRSSTAPQDPPYSYRVVAEGPPSAFADLDLADKPDLTIKKYEVRVDEVEKPLAEFHVANPDSDPVLLDWLNHITEFVLATDSTLKEAKTVAEAITKYASDDALVVAWWDISRRLELLSGIKTVFNENLAKPALIPSVWAGRDETIAAMERTFWKVPETAKTEKKFDEFVDALLSEVKDGSARLKALAGDRESYVVVHLMDILKAGALKPDRIRLAYKDFSNSGQLHGQVRRIKDWSKNQGYKAYAVFPLNDQVKRAVFLTDEASSETLIARMLPFDTSNPFTIDEITLVYQHGGYWVYRLSPTKAPDTAER